MTAWLTCHQCRLFVPLIDWCLFTGGIFVGAVAFKLLQWVKA